MKNLFIFFISFLLLQFTTLAQEGWIKQNSGTSFHLNSICFVNDTTGWIAGAKENNYWHGFEQAVILHTTDGGLSWESRYFEGAYLGSIFFINENTGWAVGACISNEQDYGFVLKTTDGGNYWQWIEIHSDIKPTLHSVYFIDSLKGWAAGYARNLPTWWRHGGVIFKTTDGGITWSLNDNYFRDIYWLSTHFTDDSTGFVVGDSELLARTSDGGKTWDLNYFLNFGNNAPCLSLYFIDKNVGWIAGSDDWNRVQPVFLYKTIDGGSTWEEVFFERNGQGAWESVYFIDENKGWICGSGIYQTSNGGKTWKEHDIGIETQFHSICFLESEEGWVVGDSGIILLITNGGVTFVEENKNDEIPTDFYLSNNYPNPFNPNTKIKYSVPQTSNVIMKVFDILGNEIESLVNEEKQTGTYEINWYATNLPSGIYFYRLQAVPTGRQAGSFVETKKMVLMK